MDPFLAEIRLFAGPFVPRGWRICDGTLLLIRDYNGLFKLIGTIYGGNGTNNFALPDLRGRTGVCGGVKSSSPHPIGESFGAELSYLTMADVPAHTHKATVTPGTGDGGGRAILYGASNGGGNRSPEGNFLGQDPDTGKGIAPYAASGIPVAMNAKALNVAIVDVPRPNVTFGVAGTGKGHNNMMPSLVLNYIICVQGIMPSRS
jgi:microcystin-dependent protein